MTEVISDLHIHSRFSRACSKQITIDNLEKWAKIKGVNLLGTGDFAHPEWIKELKEKLNEERGILYTKNNFPFILQSEISLMYTQGKGRRIHLLILAPNFEIVDKITDYLKSKGRIDYDGRPIFNISCVEFAEKMEEISDEIEIIPAHVWTPWFGLFGSKTGFDSVEEAFQDKVKNIHALETGLSSDPSMNWRLSRLDKYNLVSFSDLHSFWPWRIGREATVFEFDKLSYDNLLKALRTGEGIKKTIEVDPGYGKYHFDGHRNCNVSLDPIQSKKYNNLCPKCRKPLTIGVLNRVEELADREIGEKPENAKPFKRLIPLSEILSVMLNSGISTQKVWKEYNKLIDKFKTENNILLNVQFDDLKKITHEKIAKAVIDNRESNLEIIPGYDGEYGRPILEKI